MESVHADTSAPAPSSATLTKIPLDVHIKSEGMDEHKVFTVTEGCSTSLTISSTDGKSTLKIDMLPTLKRLDGSQETFIKLEVEVLRESTDGTRQQTKPTVVVQAGERATVTLGSNSGPSMEMQILPTVQ